MLINNSHTSPHQQHPKNRQQHQTNNQTNNPQSSTRISFQDNRYIFEERHARLSEPLEPVIRQAPLSKPQYEPVYNIYPPLQQDLNIARHQSQNQNTLEINRQIIHPRRNRNLQTPRVQFNIPHSPIAIPIDLSSSAIQNTLQTASQKKHIKHPIRLFRFNPYI